MVEHTGCVYATTSMLTCMYNAGALAGVCYALQTITGIMMVMMYTADEYAYSLLDAGNMHTTILLVVMMVMYASTCALYT